MKKALMMIAAWVAMAMCVWADDGANGAVNPPDGYVQVRLGCDQAMGKVKGAKILKLDSKGTAKARINATAARGYVFAGWYLDPDFSQPASFVTGSGENAKPKDYRYAAQSLTVTGDVSLFARFVEKTLESDPIEHLRFLGAGYCGADASESAETETWYQGVSLPTNCTVAFDSASLPKVTIKGLPAGVKCDDVRRCFTGAPKKAGEFTLTVTVKNKSGATDVLTKRVKVEPLPGWAVGRFDGYRIECGATSGTFAASVGSTGMVRGKTAGGLAPTTFSAKSFSNVFTLDGENLIYMVEVTVKSKVGGEKSVKTDTLYLMEDVGTGLGTIGGGDADGSGAVGVQRAWDRKDLAYPAFDTAALKDPIPLGNGITLKFGAKGKVKVGGKINGVKAGGLTYVLPFAWHSTMTGNLLAQVPVYVAPKKNLESGFCAVYDVLLTVGADGRFDTAFVVSLNVVSSDALDDYKLRAGMRISPFSCEDGKAAGEAWASVVDETTGQMLLDELLRRTKIDVLATPSLDKGEWSVIGSPTTDGEGGQNADERPAAETPAQMFFKLRLR